MSFTVLLGLIGFAIVFCITPGPNNLMLMTSGANFGFRRSLPHMLGIAGGILVMGLLVGTGKMIVMDAFPALGLAVKILAGGYMIWLAVKIVRTVPSRNSQADSSPLTFLQATAFQWANPKVWAMCLAGITIYAHDRTHVSLTIVVITCALFTLPASALWTWLGTLIQKWLESSAPRRIFNVTMASLLLIFTLPALASGF